MNKLIKVMVNILGPILIIVTTLKVYEMISGKSFIPSCNDASIGKIAVQSICVIPWRELSLLLIFSLLVFFIWFSYLRKFMKGF